MTSEGMYLNRLARIFGCMNTRHDHARQTIAAEVRGLMASQTPPVSGVKLARALGRSQNYAAERLRGEADWTLADLFVIADIAHVSPGAILDAATVTRTRSRSVTPTD